MLLWAATNDRESEGLSTFRQPRGLRVSRCHGACLVNVVHHQAAQLRPGAVGNAEAEDMEQNQAVAVLLPGRQEGHGRQHHRVQQLGDQGYLNRVCVTRQKRRPMQPVNSSATRHRRRNWTNPEGAKDKDSRKGEAQAGGHRSTARGGSRGPRRC